MAHLTDEHVEAATRADHALALARDAGRRARLLEHLIASLVELQGRRGQLDLINQASELVSQLFGFGLVVLYQWSDSLAAFAAQVVHRSDDAAEAGIGQHIDRAEYDQLVHPRFRVSDSYLVPPPTAAWPTRLAADEVDWPDGQRLLVPLTDSAGAVHGFFALSAPAGKRAPDLLRIRYLELLARQVAAVLAGSELRDQLASCRAELALADERLQSLGELRNNFVANVSHELRTPLTSIIGYSEMLRDRGADMSESMRREFLEVIHDQGQQLKDIINDLLDLDRMEDQSARLDRAESDLAALTRRLAEDWRQRAEAAGLTFELTCPAGALVLEADPVLCQQLLGHLVDNAIKFTRDDGAVSVRVSEQGTAVRLEVQDSGIGIPEDKLHTIFEQFYQVDGSSTREVGGQGVGLSICRDIVSWHDGRIWAENVPGGGARFTVLLPRRPHVVVPEPPAPLNPVFHDARLFLQRLVHWVSENLGVRSAVILQADAARQHLEVLAAAGVPAGDLQGLRLARGVGLLGRTWSEGVARIGQPTAADVLLADDGPVLCVPLPQEGEVIGVVAVRQRLDGRPFTEDDRVLLEAMAPRVVHLLSRFDSHADLLRDFAAIQSSLRATTCVGTLPHADVAGVCQEICLATARRLGLPEPEIRHLAFALRYYDVGLGQVPPYLLQKVEALTDAERVHLERHVQAGLVTLAPLKPPPKVREIILHHHENYDGSGYPKGLSGEAIPLGSRLVTLTDSLRALLQRRPWRPAVPLADAMAEIQAFAGTRYCPRVTAVFLEEAVARRKLIDELRQRADDGEDLKRPAPLHPVQLQRP
ncbi:MAG: ATP-binding protein [Candidatus Krumholzibacteriia bacterium]